MLLKYSSIVAVLIVVVSIQVQAQTHKEREVIGYSEFLINEPLTVARISNLYEISETDSDTLMWFVYTGNCCQKFANNIDIDQIQLLYAKEPNPEEVLRLKRIIVFLDTLTLRGRLNGTLDRLERKSIDVDRDTRKSNAAVRIFQNALGEPIRSSADNPYLRWNGSKVDILYYFNWLGKYYGSAPVLIYEDTKYTLHQAAK